MLPIEIQMQIDLSAQHHSREIAEGFAKLRAKLPPDPTEARSRLQMALMNAAQNPFNVYQMRDLRPGAITYVPPEQLQNAAWNSAYGGLNTSFLDGLFGPGY